MFIFRVAEKVDTNAWKMATDNDVGYPFDMCRDFSSLETNVAQCFSMSMYEVKLTNMMAKANYICKNDPGKHIF